MREEESLDALEDWPWHFSNSEDQELIRNFIREPWAGILNLELRTPKQLDIMCQMAPDLGLCKCPHFITGAEAKKSPLPPRMSPKLITNSGSGWAQLTPSGTGSCLKLGRTLALHHGSLGLVGKEQEPDLPGWLEELTRRHPSTPFANELPALLPQRMNRKRVNETLY